MDGDGISEMSGESRQPELEGDRPAPKDLYSTPFPLSPLTDPGMGFAIERVGENNENDGGAVAGDEGPL